jgi:hypothetical protein
LREKPTNAPIIQRDEVMGEWRKLRNEELNDLCSPNIVQVIKSRRVRWAGHVVCEWRRRKTYTGVWWGNLRERDCLGDPVMDGIIILRWVFRKCDMGYGLVRAG